MTTTLATVTLLGENTTNPGVPHRNTAGQLVADTSSLQFSGGNVRYFIPWDSIDVCEVEKEPISGMGCTKTIMLFMGFGGVVGGFGTALSAPTFLGTLMYMVMSLLGAVILVLFLFVYANHRTLIMIKHWNEEHGFDATVRFEVGKLTTSYDRAHNIVREIWGKRGAVRQKTHSATKVRIS